MAWTAAIQIRLEWSTVRWAFEFNTSKFTSEFHSLDRNLLELFASRFVAVYLKMIFRTYVTHSFVFIVY